MRKEKNNAPNLRFPEFALKPTWRETKLSEVLSEHDERSTGSEEVFSVSVHKGVVNQIEHLGRSFSSANTENYKRVLPGDLIYTKSPTGDFPYGIIKQSKVSRPVIVSPLYGVFKPETSALGVILDAYFEYPSNTYNYLSSIVQKGAKNTINITNDTFLSKSLVLPLDKDEQQKIADFLSSLDELITAENQKLETLQQYKKGLMRQLFPAEGEKMPMLRFAEFRDSGPWMEKTLGPMTEKVGSGVTPLGGKTNYQKSGRPFVRSQNVGWGVLLLDDIAFIDEQTHRDSISTEIELEDVLLNITGASIGRSAVATLEISGGNVNQHVCIIRTVKSDLRPIFLSQYLLSPFGQRQIDSLQAGGNRQGLNFAQIRSFSIPTPPDIREQQKIADFLSSLVDLIQEQRQKIENLNAYKQGLIQQLFPNVNEIE